MIALTFLFLRHLIFIPVYRFYSLNPGMGSWLYLLMITSTLLIAVAGYLSNDYFDVIADKINKPEKQYIGVHISAGLTFSIALLSSLLGTALAILLGILINNPYPVLLIFIALVVAWWYAIKLKKSLIWGNIAVAGMSAGTIAMAWLIEYQYSRVPGEPFRIITKIIIAISIFAFLLSLLREIVKDMEDLEGDRLINCRSLPLVKGIPYTKIILIGITLLTFILLVLTQVYLVQFSRIYAVGWLLAGVEIPLLYFLKLLHEAKLKRDYHKISSFLKWIMLAGIGSIIAGQF
jgi:4-hydroxybenzoate polyprenyltransferase